MVVLPEIEVDAGKCRRLRRAHLLLVVVVVTAVGQVPRWVSVRLPDQHESSPAVSTILASRCSFLVVSSISPAVTLESWMRQ